MTKSAKHPTKKQRECEHNWQPTGEFSATPRDDIKYQMMEEPVECTECGLKGTAYYSFSQIVDEFGGTED